MAQAKVPKFGAWEGGENFTVYFDNARKMKTNGVMINPNDPEDNPDMFPQKGAPAKVPPTHGRTESQGSKVPQFGAWDSGDNVGYTVCFENARKNKNGAPTKTENGPQPNRDVPAQTRPSTVKPEPQEPRTKVPQFGAWEGGGELAYTACFDNVRKNKTGPMGTEELNRDVIGPRSEPPTQEARTKVPEFGAWDGGENVQYTAYFDKARKNRGESVEPQLNRDVGERARPPSAGTRARSEEHMGQGGVRNRSEQRGTKEDGHSRNPSRGSTAGRQTAGAQSPLHPKEGKSQAKSGSRGSQAPEKAATIPAFGVWHNDPSQAEGFTGAFRRAREDKINGTPKNNKPSAYHHRTYHSNQDAKKGCCFPWL